MDVSPRRPQPHQSAARGHDGDIWTWTAGLPLPSVLNNSTTGISGCLERRSVKWSKVLSTRFCLNNENAKRTGPPPGIVASRPCAASRRIHVDAGCPADPAFQRGPGYARVRPATAEADSLGWPMCALGPISKSPARSVECRSLTVGIRLDGGWCQESGSLFSSVLWGG